MRPMFATPGDLPAGSQWCYEVEWAGLRVLTEITGDAVRLVSDNGRDVTRRFPELGALAGRVGDALLDGEIVVLDGGAPSSSALADRLARGPRPPARPVALMLFDVLRLYGVALLHRPLHERRATLERVGVDCATGVTLSPVYADGPALLAATRKHQLRGVVAKRADSPYRPGVRDPSWIAVTHDR